MYIDYELSVRIKMPDDHGIRCAVSLGVAMAKTVDESSTSTSTNTGSTAMITDDTTMTTTEIGTDTVSDLYRLIIGNQMGNMYQIGIPTTLIEPIQYRHDHTVTAILATAGTTNTTGTCSTNENNNNDDTLNLYVTGCKDGKVRFFDSSNHTLVTTIQDNGHDKPVTSLCWVYNRTRSKKYLVTGSWDGTAKVWDVSNMLTVTNEQRCYSPPTCITTLIGHENSVCVVGIDCNKYCTDDDTLIIGTGSAGMATGSQIRGQSVRIWKISISTGVSIVQHHITNDHDGPIRDITTINESNLLVTCSNDGTIKLRNNETGITLSTLQMIGSEQQQQQQNQNNQHPQILLSIGIPESDTIIAGAEDGSVAIFTNMNDDNTTTTTGSNKNGESFHQTQLLQHPQTVWKIITLPNGDFGTCCQDGWIRIFTRCADRMATQKDRDEYQYEMNELIKVQSQQQSSGPTYEEIMKLPLWENNLSKIGRTEGAVQLFNKNGQAIAAQWSQVSSTWIEVGQVMGRPNNDDNSNGTGNTMIDGIQYDYVFPIEVDGAGGSVVSLQIGYNNGENQFVAAQRFIDTHQLPQYHLTEIADYIQQRTNTSSSRMIGKDTTNGRSSNSTTSNATTGVPIAFYQYIPSKVYKSFDLPTKNAATTLEKMKSKIIDLQLLSSLSSTSINPERTLDTIMGTILQNCQTSTVSYESIEFLALLLEKCHDGDSNDTTQPKSLFNIFPIIDLARLLILHTNSLSTCISNENRIDLWKHRIIPNIIQYCQEIVSYNIPTGSLHDDEITMKSYIAAKTNIPLLSLRFFSNCLYQQAYVVSATTVVPFFLNDYLNSIVSCLEVHVKSTNKTIRTAVATTIYNLCHYIHIISKTSGSEATTTAIVPTIISLIDTIIGLRTYELESITMILISLGTIVMSNTIGKECAQSLYMNTKVEPVASLYNNDTLRTIAKEVYSVVG